MKNTNNCKQANTDYNGWKNRQTWNVSLWINNDESLYKSAIGFMNTHQKSRCPYIQFIKDLCLDGCFTPDKIKWDGEKLDYKELNEMMKGLIEN